LAIAANLLANNLQVIKERKKTFSPENTPNVLQTDEADGESPNLYFSTKKRFAFLDLLLHIQASGEHEITDKDIQEEADTITFGGHDTLATEISWTIYLLGLHPLHQAKVHEELDSIFGDDKSTSICSKDLPKLKYLEMCFKESMRLYPGVPVFSRSVVRDFELDANSVVPKGAIIMFNVYSAHRNPEIFPDPGEFRPERFSAENREKRNPCAFMPFSAGPRNCMGQRYAMAEGKTILANIFRNFRATSLDSPENIHPVSEIVLKARDGIRVKFVRR
jgi:cytochrome P450